MTRATEAFTVGGIVSVIYLILLMGLVPLSDTLQNRIIPVLPWWGLMTFGCYCLASIGSALYTFRDCPEAYHELMAEITQAKNELRSKGMQL
ncbi:dolichol-phosphate mannosyltransferase subunit 3 [Pilobolus umbonatus]|nr:dolichol-phosphate mannosyltransferase subunit 3 [Pilobolus umbonatus]